MGMKSTKNTMLMKFSRSTTLQTPKTICSHLKNSVHGTILLTAMRKKNLLRIKKKVKEKQTIFRKCSMSTTLMETASSLRLSSWTSCSVTMKKIWTRVMRNKMTEKSISCLGTIETTLLVETETKTFKMSELSKLNRHTCLQVIFIEDNK